MIWTYPETGAPTGPYPVFRLDSFWACETPEGVLALTGKFPWGQLPAFHELPQKPIHYKAYRGWDADLWHDGPEFIWDGNAVTACVLPGTDAELPARFHREGFADWLKEHEVLAWKKSLAKAFREHLNLEHDAYILKDFAHASSHALAILGLRLAFPHVNFFVTEWPTEFKPQWKRYCQNLNCSVWAAPAQLKGLETLSLQNLAVRWGAVNAPKFLCDLSQKIPFIPQTLCNMWRV